MPEGEVRVGHGGDAARLDRIANVEHQAVAGARPACDTERRIHRDVVALDGPGTGPVRGRGRIEAPIHDALGGAPQRGAVGARRRSGPPARLDDAVELRCHEPRPQHDLLAAHGRREASLGACLRGGFGRLGDVLRRFAVRLPMGQVGQDRRLAHDMRLLGMGERHLNHLDAEQLAVWILVGRERRAARQLVGRADPRRTRDVDVEVSRVLRVGHHGVGVRAAAGLHTGDRLGVRNIGDVEDADAAHPVLADRIRHALRAAVEPAVEVFAGREQQVAVDRHVVLRVGADVGRDQRGATRLRDVPHLQPVEVALDHVVSRKREIRIEVREVAQIARIGERRRLRRRGHHAQVPGRLGGVHPSGAQAHAAIGAGGRGGHIELRGGSARRDRADREQQGQGSH